VAKTPDLGLVSIEKKGQKKGDSTRTGTRRRKGTKEATSRSNGLAGLTNRQADLIELGGKGKEVQGESVLGHYCDMYDSFGEIGTAEKGQKRKGGAVSKTKPRERRVKDKKGGGGWFQGVLYAINQKPALAPCRNNDQRSTSGKSSAEGG